MTDVFTKNVTKEQLIELVSLMHDKTRLFFADYLEGNQMRFRFGELAGILHEAEEKWGVLDEDGDREYFRYVARSIEALTQYLLPNEEGGAA